jgi:WD40 repeat protein
MAVLTAIAMDCLRFSMHFFHPIQQCAQQVYHTAVPLSPILSQLRKLCLQNVTDNQLSYVTAFMGAPDEWGLLLRTIDVRPKQLTCIATSARRIVAACEDIVDIYDAVTFVLQQFLRAPETVAKIQGSPDESTLFFAHSHSITMWDVQTGGLTHTFTTRSKITDIAVSATGGRVACGSSDGFVTFWNIHTKVEGKSFGNGQPVVAIFWLSPQKLAVATRGTVYTHDIDLGETFGSFSIPGRVCGMVHSPCGGDKLEVAAFQQVAASKSGKGVGQTLSFFKIATSEQSRNRRLNPSTTHQMTRGEGLSNLTLAGKVIACMILPRGVRSFDAEYQNLVGDSPFLDAATSVAVSLNRNLVAQTEDSIQIFSLNVLKAWSARNDVYTSHVYPLGGKHIVCLLQPNRRLTVLDLRTLRELRSDDNTSSLGSLPTNQPLSARASFSRGLVAEFGISMVMQAWRSRAPFPEWAEATDEDLPVSGLSPDCTRIATFYGSPRRELRVKDAKDGTILASLPLGDGDLEMGQVYELIFDLKTGFHLKIDGPGRHVQIPYDIVPSPSGPHSHMITKAEPVRLSEPRVTPPYKLDANCEWVIDAKSRKICWVSPGDVRRGNGGHFWAGRSLVMVGDDGVVRKLSFREPGS